MAYKITSNKQISYCDAIETYTIVNHALTPIELPNADGFKAFKIIEISPQKEDMLETLYVFPGRILDEYDIDEAVFEYIEDPDEEEEKEEEIEE